MSLVAVLDTSTEYVAVGVAEVDPASGAATILAEETFLAPRRANAIVLPELQELLERGGVGPERIAAVVAGRGPGSFTGVRIGLATAKGLAHGAGVPLVAVPTLDAVAWGSVARDGILGVVGDAMRGEVYPMRYASDGSRVTRLDQGFPVRKPREVAAEWARQATGEIALLGNGLAKYLDEFVDALGDRAVLLPLASWAPTAAGLLAAAAPDLVAAFADPTAYHPAVALPIYSRLSDAEEAEEARSAHPEEASVPDSGVAGPARRGSPRSGDDRTADDTSGGT
jgi:N6-L-threonylcarbamoyladenine synthase